MELIVAIGAYRNDGNGGQSGHVRVYQYDEVKQLLIKVVTLGWK